MFGIRTIGTHSQKIIPLVFLLIVIDIFLGGIISSALELVPGLVINKSEYWRLISFPFATTSAEGLVLFLFTFYLVAPRLEKILKGGVFLSLLPPLIFLQGVIHTLLFWNSSSALSGLEGISFFVLTLFVYMNPSTHLKVRFAPSLRLVFIITALIALWGSIKFYYIYDTGSDAVLISSASALFGILTASLCYLQIRFLKSFLKSEEKNSEPDIPNPEELRMAMISAEKSYRANSRKHDSEIPEEYENFDMEPEERLDYILDKILDSGQESLTPGELFFLKNYSNEKPGR